METTGSGAGGTAASRNAAKISDEKISGEKTSAQKASAGKKTGQGAARARGRAKSSTKRKTVSRLADARARMYRELIFEAAEVVFGRKGYDGATMQDIADEAGVSLKTVYATYECKQGLYDQIMRERAAGLVARLGSAAETTDDPLEQIARLVDTYVAFVFENESWLRIHLRTRVAWALRPPDAKLAVSWAKAQEIYNGALRAGMKSGLFYPGDPAETSILVQSVMQMQMARAVELGHEDPAEVAETMMVHIRRLLCRP